MALIGSVSSLTALSTGSLKRAVAGRSPGGRRAGRGWAVGGPWAGRGWAVGRKPSRAAAGEKYFPAYLTSRFLDVCLSSGGKRNETKKGLTMFRVYHGMQDSWIAQDAQEVAAIVNNLVTVGYTNILIARADKDVRFEQIEARKGEKYNLSLRAEIQVI